MSQQSWKGPQRSQSTLLPMKEETEAQRGPALSSSNGTRIPTGGENGPVCSLCPGVLESWAMMGQVQRLCPHLPVSDLYLTLALASKLVPKKGSWDGGGLPSPHPMVPSPGRLPVPSSFSQTPPNSPLCISRVFDSGSF